MFVPGATRSGLTRPVLASAGVRTIPRLVISATSSASSEMLNAVAARASFAKAAWGHRPHAAL